MAEEVLSLFVLRYDKPSRMTYLIVSQEFNVSAASVCMIAPTSGILTEPKALDA